MRIEPKKSLTKLSYYCFWVKVAFSLRNAELNKFKWILVLQDIFFEAKYVCVLMYQIPNF